MKPQTNIQRLASAIEARANCERSPVNEYGRNLHAETIAAIMREAPSGSGIDCGTKLDEERSRLDRVVFVVEYHRMIDGYYDGWQTYRVTVRPSFSGIVVDVTGRGDEQTKDYLADVYRTWSMEECHQ